MRSKKNHPKHENSRAARDWSHSVQARFAEKISGELARVAKSESVLTGSHRDQFASTALEAGFSEEQVETMLTHHASAKVGEFDDPHSRDSIERLLAELFSTIKILKLPDVSQSVVVSSLPSGAVNALCCKNSWDPFIHIFVDADLQVFCSSISKIVLMCLYSVGVGSLLEDKEIDRQVRSPEVQLRIQDLFYSSIFHGSVRASQPFLPPAALLFNHLRLCSSLETFVIAHELAHVLCGHLEDENAASTVVVNDPKDADVLLFSQDAEFEADGTAALLAGATAKSRSGTQLIDFAGPYIFMRAVYILESCKEITGKQDGGLDSTHPPAKIRAGVLREVILRKLPVGPEMPEILQKIDRVFSALEETAVACISRSKNNGHSPRARIMLRIYEQGERPAILG